MKYALVMNSLAKYGTEQLDNNCTGITHAWIKAGRAASTKAAHFCALWCRLAMR